MTRDEAKRILVLYRPWSKDADDPAFTEALALARTDAELERWFEQHCAAQKAVRAGFKKIAPPAGLKEQIISEQRARLISARQRRNTLVATLAVVILILGVGTGWWIRRSLAASETDFAAYRSRMVRTALKNYGMELETNSAPAIRAYLAQHQAYADYVLPAPLVTATNTGCGVLKWQGHRVTMVCFHSGRPLPSGEKTDLFLFVMERSAAADAPGTNQPQFARVNQLNTATWSQDGMIYLLAAPGDEEFLKKFL